MGLFSRSNAPARFWEWFQRNSDRLYHFETDQESVFAELSGELARVHRGLAFEFGPEEGGRREFVVSADGIRAVFPAVQELVRAAPPLPGWKITAFRPPRGLDMSITIGAYSLSADDVWFAPRPAGRRIGLRLHVRGLNKRNEGLLGQAAFILLDSAIGEYAAGTRVGPVELRPLPDDPAAQGLHPLVAIGEVLQIEPVDEQPASTADHEHPDA
jgi:hypothetical protein